MLDILIMVTQRLHFKKHFIATMKCSYPLIRHFNVYYNTPPEFLRKCRRIINPSKVLLKTCHLAIFISLSKFGDNIDDFLGRTLSTVTLRHIVMYVRYQNQVSLSCQECIALVLNYLHCFTLLKVLQIESIFAQFGNIFDILHIMELG